ncbi:MAG: hypothetical protein R8F63_00760 [Acidimicrobiales bacterium]|nr:hypothetical protein [Acidimicrobiales bacterium]
MNEVIRVRVLDLRDSTLEFRNVVTGARGKATIGESHLVVGMEAVIDLEIIGAKARVTRVVEPAPPLSADDLQPIDSDHVPPVTINGEPLETSPPDVPVAVGQVRTAVIAFNSYATSGRDRGATAKVRPCVVVEIDGEHACVCPIYGSGTTVRKSDSGRRLLRWREAGLRKSSQVSAEATWVARTTLGPLIGVLEREDRRRLGL